MGVEETVEQEEREGRWVMEYGQPMGSCRVDEPKRLLAVPEGFGRVDKALQRLGGGIESLRSRLEYVSRMEGPALKGPEGPIGQLCGRPVPAVAAIDDFVSRLNALTDLVNGMTGRLEI